MRVDLQILEKFGSSNDALKELFTCPAPAQDDQSKFTEAECTQRKEIWDRSRKIRDRINCRLTENINLSLRNYSFYSAVDLAFEPPPLARKIWPLVLYATGKINTASCMSQLKALGPCADQFVKRNDDGVIVDIDLPRFTDVAIGLMRSVITRRLAAQSNKYNNLFPYYKYESRSISQTGKLRADLMSQRMDIMADQFGYKHHDTQVYRDALLYGHSVDFIRASWEREYQWYEVPKAEGDESKTVKPEATLVREGLSWVNPHPTRVFWDNSAPLASINDDNGPSFIGFWDVLRFGDIMDQSMYWNTKALGYTSDYQSIFQTYGDYFSQYYCTINAPVPGLGGAGDQVASNDRKNLVGIYSSSTKDASIVLANYYEKFIPQDWGIGDYPYPVWARFVVAGWDTVVFAEFLPSTPAAVLSYNERDDRQVNLGVGHELLPYQDQMTNLLSALLLALKGDNIKVLVLDTDTLNVKQLEHIRNTAKGGKFANEAQIIEVSRSKLQELGIKLEDVIELVETKSSTQITLIFNAMLTLMNLVQQMMALSPQEQGQPAPREISATETNLIAGTTESVYNFISDAIDEYRAAKKRISQESWVVFGQPTFKLPALGQYTQAIVDAAGLKVEEDAENNQNVAEGGFIVGDIIGRKRDLIHDYIFTSRDGAERTSNVQAAQYLTEGLKTLFAMPTFAEIVTKGQLKDILNEFFRMTGAFDLKLQPNQGDDQPLAPSASDQFQQTLEGIVQQQESQSKTIQQVLSQLAQITGQPTNPTNTNGNPSSNGSRSSASTFAG